MKYINAGQLKFQNPCVYVPEKLNKMITYYIITVLISEKTIYKLIQTYNLKLVELSLYAFYFLFIYRLYDSILLFSTVKLVKTIGKLHSF